MKNNIHAKHRQRVKSMYLSAGIDSMADHSVIELLLFFGLPYKDTNIIAHELIEKFGNLNGVIDAPVEELMKIDGVGQNAATLIHLVRDISKKYRENNIDDKTNIGSFERFTNYLTMKYMGETREIVYLLCIDPRGNVQQCIKVGEGSPESATVNNRTIVETALRSSASDIIITHNHPSGFCVPSVADIRATEQIIPLLNSLSISLIDHIIVADDGCFSMSRSDKYRQIFDT